MATAFLVVMAGVLVFFLVLTIGLCLVAGYDKEDR